jgi:hypothetical protein
LVALAEPRVWVVRVLELDSLANECL